jgi:serine/threonine protein kinase
MAVSAAPQDSSSTGDTLPPGTPLLQGQYLVEGYLNSGGFGVTYLARDSLERRVVLKECYPASMCCRAGGIVRARSQAHQSEFETVVRLFGQEARRLAKLEHPNIVGVRDVFEENGTAYMALDYVDGRDLHDVIEQETWRLDPDTVREIAVQLLDAIGHVHGMGMLHRDISPDNILLTQDDTPILIDFGAARDSAWRKSRVLSTLHVVKDGYSPQEFYLQAGEQSPASDLYSLAASLYRAITGDPPVFSHRRLAAIAERRPDPYVPLEGTADGYDPAFLRMIDTALAVFARDRVQSAADWLAAIELAPPQEAVGPVTPLPDPTMDDAVIVERVRRLVEATNPEVRALHAERTRELEERARCEAEERAAQEAARCRRLEEARREAEEAERAYRERQRQESEARRALPAPAPSAAPAEEDEEAVVPQGDGEVPHVPGAGGVNRAKLLKERVEQKRREREQAEAAALSREDGSGGPADRSSRGSLFGLMLGGGWLRPATRDASSKEGFGA